MKAMIIYDVLDDDGFGSYGMKLPCDSVEEASQAVEVMCKNEHYENVRIHELDYLDD